MEPNQTPVPAPVVKAPWWTWIMEDPRKAVRLAFIAAALIGYDLTVPANRVASVSEQAADAVKKADESMKVIDDLKLLVLDVKAKQDDSHNLLKAVNRDNQLLLKSTAPK